MTKHHADKLTSDGVARRDAMLGELVGTMRRVHHGRRVRRRAASALAVLTIFAGITWIIGSQSPVSDTARPQIAINPSQQPVPDAPSTERLIQLVDDEELVALLAQLDRPAGIVRSEGEIWLTSPVTDVELGLTPPLPETVDPSTM